MAVKSDFWNASVVSNMQELPLRVGRGRNTEKCKRREVNPQSSWLAKQRMAGGQGKASYTFKANSSPGCWESHFFLFLHCVACGILVP